MEHWPHVTGADEADLWLEQRQRSLVAHSHGGGGLEESLLDHNLLEIGKEETAQYS